MVFLWRQTPPPPPSLHDEASSGGQAWGGGVLLGGLRVGLGNVGAAGVAWRILAGERHGGIGGDLV